MGNPGLGDFRSKFRKISRISGEVGRGIRRTPHLYRSERSVLTGNSLIAVWANRGLNLLNWGDALNPILIQHISGKEVVHRRDVWNIANRPVFAVVGSILERITDSNTVVWGPGFVNSKSSLRVRPSAVHAVRGPLTRAKFLELGVDCPEVYGDPALLYPLFYKPQIRKSVKVGIVPHYVDQDARFLDQFKHDPTVLVIDIRAGIQQVVDEISRCEVIASSSLHGLIVADAYGIPSVWIKCSEKVVGEGFKFRDYFAAVGKNVRAPVCVVEDTTMESICDKVVEPRIDLDLQQLLSVCPFKNPAAGL